MKQHWGFPGASAVKNSFVMQEVQEAQFLSLGWEDPLEEGMATHSSILAWRIPWTEEPGGLRSMGSQRVRQGMLFKLHCLIVCTFCQTVSSVMLADFCSDAGLFYCCALFCKCSS